MGKNKTKLKLFLTLTLVIFCLGFFIDSAKAVDIEASASRTSGVAPLSIHFNADLTASSETERSFHDLEYAWNFGDTNAGNWGINGKPKNEDKGPVAAHVYETPGTYIATLVVKDLSTGTVMSIEEKTFTITVTDPNIVYSGTNTTCISTDTDFAGCPSGAIQVTTSDISNLSAYGGEGRRILFKMGAVWNVTSTPSWGVGSTDGPKTIGAYGTCSGLDELGICSNAPHFIITTDTGVNFINLSNRRNYRLIDVHVSATSYLYDTNMIYGKQGIKDFLALRVKGENIGLGVSISNYRQNDTDYPDKLAVVSSSFSSTYLQSIYMGGERLFIMGNILADGVISHVSRIWKSYLGVISHNIISGASLTNEQKRHALKFHSPMDARFWDHDDNPDTPDIFDPTTTVGTYAETGAGGQRTRTQFNVISNNVFGTSGAWTVSIGPQGDRYDERVSDLIFEKNRVIADYGNSSVTPVQIGTMAEGRYMSFRNNIFDGTGGASGYQGLLITQRGIEPAPEYNQIYNNTVYRSDAQSGNNTGITIGSSATNTTIKNNYVSFPSATGTTEDVVDVSGVSTISDNIYTNNPYFTDSDNANPFLRDFSLTFSATEAINQGVTVPVFDDFTGQSRIGVYDIGAFEYAENTSFRADVDGSSQITTTDALLTLRNSLGLSMTGTAWQASATTGDVNCDGVSNSTDALLILRHSLGLSMSGTSWCE